MGFNQCKRLIASILGGALLVISGCATGPTSMSDAQRAEIRTASRVNVLYHGLKGPVVQTVENVLKFEFSFGLAGWDSIGEKIVKENAIEDPMLTTRNRFMARLKVEGKMRNLAAFRQPTPIDLVDIEKLRQRYPKGLYLQIFPGQWTVIYYVANWSKYHMLYNAHARLVRADDGKILWRSFCNLDRDDGDRAPSMNQLLANRAARLKTWARESAQKCADTLADAYLGKSN